MTHGEPTGDSEIDDLLKKIIDFQKTNNRKVARKFRLSQQNESYFAEFEDNGIRLPDDVKSLYQRYDGTETFGSFWDMSVFFEFMWSSMKQNVDMMKLSVLKNVVFRNQYLVLFSSFRSGSLFVDVSHDSETYGALYAWHGPSARNKYLAFDSTVAMLRSVCAAQDAGLLRYRKERGDGEEKGQIQYDPKAVWDVIRVFNPRSTYWPALAAGPIDWDFVETTPSNGILNWSREEQCLLLGGDPRDLDVEIEQRMRKRGRTDADVIAIFGDIPSRRAATAPPPDPDAQ